MKGVVKSIVEVQKRDGSGSYYKAVIESDGKAKEYLVRSDNVAAVQAHGSNEFEFQTQPSRDGTALWLKFPNEKGNWKGGGGRGSDESFAASYTKDTVNTCITAGMLKDSGSIKAAIEFFYPIYLKLVKPQTPSAS